MKWMLVVLVFGSPMETGLFYNSLDECLKTEATVRAEWDRVYMAIPKTFQEKPPVSQDYVKTDDQRHLYPARRTRAIGWQKSGLRAYALRHCRQHRLVHWLLKSIR